MTGEPAQLRHPAKGRLLSRVSHKGVLQELFYRAAQFLRRAQQLTLDFMRDALFDRPLFHTLNGVDEGSRDALRIKVATSIPSTRVVGGLDQLPELYGRPDGIRLDSRLELTADVYMMQLGGIQH